MAERKKVTKSKIKEGEAISPNIAEELYKRNVELAITNKTLSLLRKLYQISLATIEPKSFHDQVTHAIRTELNLELAGVLLFNPERESLVPIDFSLSDRLAEQLRGEGIMLKDVEIDGIAKHPLLKKVVLSREQYTTENILDVWDSLKQSKFFKDSKKRGHIKTIVASPLSSEKKVFGVLLLGLNREYESLNSFEKDSIYNLTDVVAIGLDRANIYKELQEANEKLKSLDKLKSEFLSLASHQLRTPLTAIKGYASMLMSGDFGEINEKVKHAIDSILKSSMNLSTMVEDFLNVSKIEQGGMKYEKVNFDLGEVAGAVAKDLSMIAEGKGLKFSYTQDAGAHAVNGDKEKIRQVVINFIDNAIKYTKEGSIAATLSNKDGKVVFAVKDTGMGVTPEIKSTLFQKFSRGEGGKVNTTGSGLGLYLAKEIIVAHGGRVGVESAGAGKGSTFFLELEGAK